jgi:hypothetical protein
MIISSIQGLTGRPWAAANRAEKCRISTNLGILPVQWRRRPVQWTPELRETREETSPTSCTQPIQPQASRPYPGRCRNA